VNGWIHFGMASIGVNPSESAMRRRVDEEQHELNLGRRPHQVATKVPMPMPVSTQQAQAGAQPDRLVDIDADLHPAHPLSNTCTCRQKFEN
jgi:hypothetical protein